MLKKTTNKSIENIRIKKLSIQFSLGGFSFCISNEQDELYHLSSFEFKERLNSPQELQEKIEQIFKTEKMLHHDFQSVLVIHQNQLNTFVPKEYFNEHKLENYLEYSVKTLQTDLLVYDTIEVLDLVNVYIPYININNYFFQNFGEFEFKHHSTVLVEKLHSYASKEATTLFGVYSTNSLEIIGFEQGNFSFYNSFDITTPEDFIYYFLFVMEQLKLSTEETQVYLAGEINERSEYFKIAYKYIRNVDFLAVQNSFFIGNDDFEVHSNFTLVG